MLLFVRHCHRVIYVLDIVVVLQLVDELQDALFFFLRELFQRNVRNPLKTSGYDCEAVVLKIFLDIAERLELPVYINKVFLIVLVDIVYTTGPSFLTLKTHLWSNMKLTQPWVPRLPPTFVK